jgi:hypothetical protein
LSNTAGIENSTLGQNSLLDSQGSRREGRSRRELKLLQLPCLASFIQIVFQVVFFKIRPPNCIQHFFQIMIMHSKALLSKNSTKLTNMWNNYSKQHKLNLIAFIQNSENKSV